MHRNGTETGIDAPTKLRGVSAEQLGQDNDAIIAVLLGINGRWVSPRPG
jgi:hypothetical protein